MCDLEDIHHRISQEWKRLSDIREESQATWKDDVANRFSKQFFTPWETEMPQFLQTLERLDREIGAAYREIQDE